MFSLSLNDYPLPSLSTFPAVLPLFCSPSFCRFSIASAAKLIYFFMQKYVVIVVIFMGFFLSSSSSFHHLVVFLFMFVSPPPFSISSATFSFPSILGKQFPSGANMYN
jgi:hypothetical protein